MSEKTIFEKIIEGEIPAHKIYEDEYTFAFLDINPINPGHTLVIPKTPSRNIFDIPKDDFLHVMETAHMLAPKIKEAVGAEGINIGINNEAAAGQEVFHLHVHIMPRFNNDNHEHWGGAPYKDGEAEEVHKKITSLL